MRRTLRLLLALIAGLVMSLLLQPSLAHADDARSGSMPAGELMFISLEGHPDYRWNANDSASKNSVIHLDNAGGSNCCYCLDAMGDGWYGIKHVKSNGTDRFVDVDGKSRNKGAVLHLWEDEDSKVSGYPHRQFAFIADGKDASGNALYYIQNRNSGLYIGIEHDDLQSRPKVLQTDKAHAKRWYVTPSTFPITGGEMNVLEGNGGWALAEIYEANSRTVYHTALNQRNDSDLRPHFYEMGTTSKWALTWYPKYQAFRIEAIDLGSEDVEGRSLDVEGESGKTGAGINIWANQSFDKNYNTSQLWRFEDRGNGRYAIRNARTGLYLQNASKLGFPLTCGNDPTLVVVSIIAGGSEEGSQRRTNFAYADPWMEKIPDEALLSSVNIPGSHDTGTAAITQDMIQQISFARCQHLFYGEQLNVGIRSFDIRCDAGGSNAETESVQIVHGGSFWKCSDRDGSGLKLGSILSDTLRFLEQHPSESVIMLVKADGGSEQGLEHALASWIETHIDKVWCGEGIPSMGEARGKIVFMRRFPLTGSYGFKVTHGLGLDLTRWNDMDFRQYHALSDDINTRTTADGATRVLAQDAYNQGSASKLNYIEDAMYQTRGRPYLDHTWVYNYTSCAGVPWVPLQLSRDINHQLWYDQWYLRPHEFLGQVMLNFADEPTARLFYESNDGLLFEPKVAQPTVTLERGCSLAEAEVTPAKGAPQGSYSFKDAEHVVTQEEADEGATFELTFTPRDRGTFRSVSLKAPVTLRDPVPLSACIYRTRSTYGDMPQISYSVDMPGTLDYEELNRLFSDVEKKMTIQGHPGLAIDASLPAGSYVLDGPSELEGHKVTWRHADAADLVVEPSGASNPIHVKAVDAVKTYGDVLDASELTCTLSDAEAAKLKYGDTLASLGITLRAVRIAQDGSITDDICDLSRDPILGAYGDAGTYRIVGEATNVSYQVVVDSGILVVRCREAGLSWPDQKSFVYTGKPAQISVRVTGLLLRDGCEVKNLRGTDAVDVGSHTAIAWGLTNKNYLLAPTTASHMWSYEITPGDPDVSFPTQATITYGQRLAEAEFSGQSGDGVFSFADSDAKPTVEQSGDAFEMTFTPSDDNYHSATAKVPVTVRPCELTVVPDEARKTYGDGMAPGLLTYSVVGALAEGDTLDDVDMDIALTAGKGECAMAPVGTYPITAKSEISCRNSNYVAHLAETSLAVEPRPVTVAFEGAHTFAYDGKPVSITASVGGAVRGDDVSVVLEGANETEPGRYEASVSGLAGEDRENYVLDEAGADASFAYEILRPDEPEPSPSKPDDGTRDDSARRRDATTEKDASTHAVPHTVDEAVSLRPAALAGAGSGLLALGLLVHRKRWHH